MTGFYDPPPEPEIMLRTFCEWLARLYRLKITLTIESIHGSHTSIIDRRKP